MIRARNSSWEARITREYQEIMTDELLTGGDDSYLLIEKCYEQLKKIFPAYSDQNLEILFRLNEAQEQNSALFQKIREVLLGSLLRPLQ